MTNSEKTLAFKRLFVAVDIMMVNINRGLHNKILNEADVDKAISDIDEMIALLPIPVTGEMNAISEPVLLINPKDPDEEPKEKKKKENGMTKYVIPEGIIVLRESNLLFTLEHWKFMVFNCVTVAAPEESSIQKYKPLMLAQADKCLGFFPSRTNLYPHEMDKVILYSNQIGWYAFLDEQDPVKLEKALTILEDGAKHSNWYDRKYIKDTYVRLLLKLGKEEVAFSIVAEAFEQDENYPDFQDLKNNEQYLRWEEGDIKRKKEAAIQKEKEKEAFRKTIKAEQKKVKDQFIAPDHPLVQQHAAILNVIKQRMVAIRLILLNDAEPDEIDDYNADFALHTWSVKDLETFETKHALQLPEEYKVYLMEIGSGGGAYFWQNGIEGLAAINKKEITRMKKHFPVTSDKIHDIENFYKVKAWVYPEDEEWIDEGVFPEGTDMETLFGLPDGAELIDGCLLLGNSAARNALYLIMNGEFKGEVWSDRLEYGAEVRGCFGAASTKRLKLLEFIAESLLAREKNASGSDQGDWM